MKKIAEIAQELLLVCDEKDSVVDFTCGNGNDTYFLATHFKEVYAFDIQTQAVLNTKERCKEFDNVHVYQTSHDMFDQYITTFSGGIFNLGYLPQGDKTITTDADTVIKTLLKIWKYGSKVRMVLVLYPGFDAGKSEARQIEEYTRNLASKHYDVLRFQLINRRNSPYIICIDYRK